MAKVKGLGRGLDALLGGEQREPPERLSEIPVALLQPGRYQPRTQMDPEGIADLAESIKTQGVIQPILVRPLAEDRYEIIAGERRWRAARMAGLETVPALVREVRDDLALAMALIENIQREDLNPIEEAHGIQRLIEEFGMTHEAAAAAVGRSRSGVTNLLRLLALPPPVQDLMLHGKLDMGHGRALLALPGAKQIVLGNRIAAKQLSVRQAEQLVRHELRPRARAPARRDPDVARLEDELSDALGMRVRIQSHASGKGQLVIDYGSLDQLDALISRLR